MILIVGLFEVREERLAEFLTFARDWVEEERRAPGCANFDILQDVTEAKNFVRMESWRDYDTLHAHAETDINKHNEEKFDSFLEGPIAWSDYEG